MRAAIDLLTATEVGEGGRRVAVLGDMLELGAHSRRLHVELAGVLNKSAADTIYLGGPEMKALAEALGDGAAVEYRASAAELEPVLIAGIRPGDAIMVKSSKGIGFSRIVDALLKTFPAVQEAAKPT